MYPSELIRKQALRQGLSPRTIHTYQICVEQFFRKCAKDPFYVSKKDIQEYLDILLEKNTPGNTLNVHLHSLKFFYERVLHRKLTINFKYSKTPKSLPTFLTQEETVLLLQAIKNRKHKLAIALLYSAGLRISELLNLQVQDLQLEQNYGWVRRGKGNKDRPFIVAQKLKEELQQWISQQSLFPEKYIFSGMHEQYTASSIRQILQRARKKAKIDQHLHPHTLRHSFATHFLENGNSVTELQPLLGHSRIETTMIYTHLAAPKLLNLKSPYDTLQDKPI